MRVKVSFSEYNGFYAVFSQDSLTEAMHVEFNDTVVRYEGDYEPYSGEYNVTPMPYEEQVLETAQKLLNNDITVFAIPYSSVSNDSGGLTATIGAS